METQRRMDGIRTILREGPNIAMVSTYHVSYPDEMQCDDGGFGDKLGWTSCGKWLSPGNHVRLYTGMFCDGTGCWCGECAAKHKITVGTRVMCNGNARTRLPPNYKHKEVHFASPSDRLNDLRTQKARGIGALQRAGFTVPPTTIIQSPKDLQHLKELLQRMMATKEEPVWVRPAPKRPRHGFVESRAAYTPRTVAQVWRETIAADDEGELLIQPMLPAKASAILTPASLTFGPGNDGATAGKNARTYALGRGTNVLSAQVLKAGGVTSKKESPYVELVWPEDEDTPYFVQLRSGPKVSGAADYVPRKMKVQHVYVLKTEEWTSSTALTDWETLVPTFAKGTVVYHKGGALATHFGVHCALNKVAYMTSRCPEVGETLDSKVKEVPIMGDMVRDGLLLGLYHWDEVWAHRKDFGGPLLCSMFALHNAAAANNDISYKLLGVSAATMFRIMAMACIGEMRHFASTHSYDYQDLLTTNPWLNTWWNSAGLAGSDRSSVFVRAWDYPHQRLVEALTVVTRANLTFKWGPSMGGLNWGRCSLTALRLHESMVHVLAKPSDRAVRNMIRMLNRAVTMVHNNGSLFNKFARQRDINAASALNRNVLLYHVTPALLKLQDMKPYEDKYPKVKPRTWQRQVGRTLIRYADNPKSLKRAHGADGTLDSYMGEMVAKLLVSVTNGILRSAYKDAVYGVLLALHGSWTRPVDSPTCLECGRTRKSHATPEQLLPENIASQVCRFGCDNAELQHAEYQLHLKSAAKVLQARLDRLSLDTCPDWFKRAEHVTYVADISKDGNPICGWRHVPPPEASIEIPPTPQENAA